MNKKQLRDLIVETLKEIDLYSVHAVNLLMGTAAQESDLGEYIKQIRGPALGIFQMEPATFDDICNNYLKYKTELFDDILDAACIVESDALVWNLKLAICMTRIHYLRVSEPLPSTIEGYAKYWKIHYNTRLGKGTEHQFIYNYQKHVM